MDPTLTHAQQISKDVSDSLLKAGISRRYHGNSLTKYGDKGQAVLDALKAGTISSQIRSGKGFYLFSEQVGAHEAFVTTVLAFIMERSITTRVVDPINISGWIEDRDWDELEILFGHRMLALTPFWSKGETPPYDTRQLRRLESWLNDFMTKGGVLFIHGHAPPLTGLMEMTTYTEEFRKRLRFSMAGAIDLGL